MKHRAANALGLGFSTGALIGVAVATVGLVAAYISVRRSKSSAKSAKADRLLEQIVPTTRGEMALFLVFCVTIGIAWELLYRGYLLWVLTPHIGAVGAIVIASAAYGAAHGYQSHRLFACSLLAALVMTCAYALTHSLWWLMLIHIALPMMGVVSRYPARRRAGLPEARPLQAPIA